MYKRTGFQQGMNIVLIIGRESVYSFQFNKLFIGYWKHARRDQNLDTGKLGNISTVMTITLLTVTVVNRNILSGMKNKT